MLLFCFTTYVLLLCLCLIGANTRICNSGDECANVHLQHFTDDALLKGRCSPSFDSSSKLISYVHIPKTGGSSLSLFVQQNFPSRFHVTLHETFPSLHLKHTKNILVAQFRDPVSRAVSWYNYINSFPKVAKGNKIWTDSFGMNPVQWSQSKEVHNFIEQDELAMFLTDISNVSTSCVAYESWKEFHAHPSKLSTIDITQEQKLTNYTSLMPPEFRCPNQLNIALLLIKYFAVVGTLEQRNDFLQVLFRRAHLDPTLLPKAKSVHANASSNKYTATPGEMHTVEMNLHDGLYCSRVLWQIAGAIGQYDLKCPLLERVEK